MFSFFRNELIINQLFYLQYLNCNGVIYGLWRRLKNFFVIDHNDVFGVAMKIKFKNSVVFWLISKSYVYHYFNQFKWSNKSTFKTFKNIFEMWNNCLKMLYWFLLKKKQNHNHFLLFLFNYFSKVHCPRTSFYIWFSWSAVQNGNLSLSLMLLSILHTTFCTCSTRKI